MRESEYAIEVDGAVTKLAYWLLDMEPANVALSLEEFELCYPGNIGRACEWAFELDAERRVVKLMTRPSEARLAMLEQAAKDYGLSRDVSSGSGDSRGLSSAGLRIGAPEDRYEALRSRARAGVRESAYAQLMTVARTIDPVVARQAAPLEERLRDAQRVDALAVMPVVESIDAVSIVVGAAAGVVLDCMVDVAIWWLRQHRSLEEASQVIRIYSPNGSVLREVAIDDDKAAGAVRIQCSNDHLASLGSN
jgi:hypothetical protein